MKSLRRLLTVLVVLSLLAAAVWWFTRTQPILVVVHEVSRGQVEATLSNTRAGEIEACQRTKMATIVGGRIDYLGVKEGDRVEAGQVLMRLWHEDLDARLAVNEAQLATARQRVREACTVADNAEREAARQARFLRYREGRCPHRSGSDQSHHHRSPASGADRALRRHRGQHQRRTR